MADRTSASLFATFFEMLAKDPTDEHKAMARKLWPMRREYDFSEYQMYCDEALKRLGLARRRKDKYGEMSIQYANHDGSGWDPDGFEEGEE
jgi:hypothetical protein